MYGHIHTHNIYQDKYTVGIIKERSGNLNLSLGLHSKVNILLFFTVSHRHLHSSHVFGALQ